MLLRLPLTGDNDTARGNLGQNHLRTDSEPPGRLGDTPPNLQSKANGPCQPLSPSLMTGHAASLGGLPTVIGATQYAQCSWSCPGEEKQEAEEGEEKGHFSPDGKGGFTGYSFSRCLNCGKEIRDTRSQISHRLAGGRPALRFSPPPQA